MILLAASAAFVGLVHSLAPGHWIPVVLVVKTRNWKPRKALLGAFIAASGHILLSIAAGGLALLVGEGIFVDMEETFEPYAAMGLVAFGAIYAIVAYLRHSGCSGHGHHGPEVPDPRRDKAPYLFLFSIGFSPCIAVLPIFGAAAAKGAVAVALTMAAFSMGVLAALVGATLLVSLKVMKLDHPFLEHYGDVLTGVSVVVLGLIILSSSI
jgi:cytochrome c biogenesis protein CcdA